MVKLVLKYCVQKRVIKFERLKLTQNFYDNKTGFVRPGHICNCIYIMCICATHSFRDLHSNNINNIQMLAIILSS